MSEHAFDVIVVGAGPAGEVAAGRLAVGEGGDDVVGVEGFVGGVTVADRAADRVAGAEQVPPRPAAAMRRSSTPSEPAGLSIIVRSSSRRFCERRSM